MTSGLKVRVITALVLVFIAGVAVGLFGGAWHARHVLFHQHPPDSPARLRQHLQHELGLTSEQAEKIGPIVDRTAAELEQIRRTTNERVLDVLTRAHAEVAPLLSAEQQARLNKLEERHRRALHNLHPPPP